MNELKEFRPPQADLNEALDSAQMGIEQTFTDVEEATKWLREATGADETKQVVDLLSEIGHDRARLLKEREDLLVQMDSLLETIGEEKTIDLAGALLRSESALQKSVETQQVASDALAEAKEIAFGDEVSEDELESIQPIMTEVKDRLPSLEERAESAMRNRAARLARNLEADEVVERLVREAREEVIKPKAWADISWYAAN